MAGFQLSINGRFWVSTEAFDTRITQACCSAVVCELLIQMWVRIGMIALS